MWKWLFLFWLLPSAAIAAPNNANDLQRTVWACEAAAPSLAKAPDPQRFFLGTVDESAHQRNVPPLVLQSTRLTGLGSVSGPHGWFNIRFSCTLSSDLAKATSFTFQVLSPIPPNKQPPSGVIHADDSAKMRWRSEDGAPVTLRHGVPETDNEDFYASCAKGSGQVYVILSQSVRWLRKDSYATIGITGGAHSGLYIARALMDDESASYVPHFVLPPGDPLLGSMTGGESLQINIGADLVYEVSLKNAAPAVKAFAVACRAKR